MEKQIETKSGIETNFFTASVVLKEFQERYDWIPKEGIVCLKHLTTKSDEFPFCYLLIKDDKIAVKDLFYDTIFSINTIKNNVFIKDVTEGQTLESFRKEAFTMYGGNGAAVKTYSPEVWAIKEAMGSMWSPEILICRGGFALPCNKRKVREYVFTYADNILYVYDERSFEAFSHNEDEYGKIDIIYTAPL